MNMNSCSENIKWLKFVPAEILLLSRLILGDTKGWDENIDDGDQENADCDEIVDFVCFADIVLILNIVSTI